MQSRINGLKLGYDDLGSGPAVVLIHGFPLRRQMWRPQVEALIEAGFRVVLPDLPGFGESQAAESTSMDLYADTLVALLDHLGIGKAAVGGMSMGGYVLLNLLQRHPQRLSAAMFVVTRAAADDAAGKARRDAMIAAVKAGERDLVPQTFADVLFAAGTPARRPQLVAEVLSWMRAVSPSGLVGALAAMRDRADSVRALATIDHTCLVIAAGADRTIAPEHSEALANGLGNVHSVQIPDAGHMVNLEQPDLFNKALIDFLVRL